MTEAQLRQCSHCEHFEPPTDPKFHKIPEFGGGEDEYNFGQGYMNHSRCRVVTETTIEGTDIPVLINHARSKVGECGPDAKFYEPKPVVTILDTIIDKITEACKPKF